MPSSPEELEEALKVFRQDLLRAFAELEVELDALRSALLETPPISRARLKKLRQEAMENIDRYKTRYAERIALAHELR